MKRPVHETETGRVVVYTGRWGATTLKPVVGESWLTMDQPRARFEEGKPLEVAEAHDNDGDRVLRCRSVVGVTTLGWAQVQFFNAGQSIVASISYKAMKAGRPLSRLAKTSQFPNSGQSNHRLLTSASLNRVTVGCRVATSRTSNAPVPSGL